MGGVRQWAADWWGVIVVGLVLLAIAGLALWELQPDISALEAWLEGHAGLGAVVYVLLLTGAVVVAPFSSLPLVPVAARLYGVAITGLLNAAGWWLGALIAFQIARVGRRFLERFTSLEAIDRLEQKIPEDIGFSGIVVAIMIFPTDIASFSLGLLRRLSFRVFAFAALVGILPFSFIWAYAGGELESGRWLTFVAIAAGMALLVLALRRLWKRGAG
jgi:uncharacterized membrane protein YdjX (TVP38/TMEM64 family)